MADEEKKAKLAAAKKKLKQVKKQALNESSNISNGTSIDNSPNKKQINSEHKILTPHPVSSNHSENSQIIPTVSTEKLNLITKQVSDLAQNSSAFMNGECNASSDRDFMEKRIHELAHLLEEQRRLAGDQNLELVEMKKENEKLKENLDSDRKLSEEKWKKDYAALKEQLQVHIQTIGILVAEKTELQSSYNQLHKVTESKHQEIEDLAGRLRASRQRLSDLEKDMVSINANNQKLEKANKEMTKEIDQIKIDTYKNNKSSEELKQHNLELQSKLQMKINEVTKLEDEMIEMKGSFEMSKLHLQQLQGSQDKPDGNITKQIEKFLTEKTELLTKTQQLEESLKLVKRERDSHALQYTQVIDKLQVQVKEQNEQIKRVIEDRDLEAKLRRDLENSFEHLRELHAGENSTDNSEEISLLTEKLNTLTTQHTAILNENETIRFNNQQLSRLLEDKEMRLSELELVTKEHEESALAHAGLLDSIQNDKTAISRATAQNKDLKQQLHELQDQFVKMSTDNMELATQLHTEQHNLKELTTNYNNLQVELQDLKNQLSVKEDKLADCLRTLSLLNEEEVNMSSTHNQQQHIILDGLQQKLHSAQNAITTLTNENSDLQNQILNLEKMPLNNGVASEHIEQLNSTISQLEMDRSSLTEQLTESQKLQNLLKQKLVEMQQNLSSTVPATINGNVVTKIQFEALQNSMFQLEEKYKRIMEDKASLMELTEQQEHIILQLQGESDTIGEYVSLYQQQRTLLRQRAAEKDSYIFQMSHERSDLQHKFTQLQNLVVQLLEERQKDVDDIITSGNDSGSYGKILSGEMMDAERKKERLVNGHEHDWPDYSDDENEGKTETPQKIATYTPLSTPTDANQSSGTARKILHLLNEIGGARDHNIMPCPHCHGQLIIV